MSFRDYTFCSEVKTPTASKRASVKFKKEKRKSKYSFPTEITERKVSARIEIWERMTLVKNAALIPAWAKPGPSGPQVH